MAAGATNAQGIYLYGEDDPAAPLSALLNRLGQSVSDRLAAPRFVMDASDGTTNVITATAWSPLPGAPVKRDVTVTRPSLALVTYGATVVRSAPIDVRAGVQLSGATVQGPQLPDWGAVLWVTATTPAGGVSLSAVKLVNLAAGTTTLEMVAYRGAEAGSVNVNYPVVQVAVL